MSSSVKLPVLVVAVSFILLVYGAIPFLGVPALGIPVWSMGFAMSFVNDSLFSIYATNFGMPEPAPMAFGLAGALPTSWFIRMGLSPGDAYSAMAAVWLLLSFYAAMKISYLFGSGFYRAILAGVVWLTMPVVWAHAGYAMLSLGFALLPLYFWAAIKLFLQHQQNNSSFFVRSLFYCLVCILAVFMDGYSFMMFACGSSFLVISRFILNPEDRAYLLKRAVWIHVAGFGIAYLLYALYIGKTQFQAYPMDFFRGWGADLIFFALPTQGIHWIPDLLGLSVTRSGNEYFGDSSVWKTTFSLPIFLAAFWIWVKIKKSQRIVTGFLVIALFGFYMSLGPSLKVASVKQSEDLGRSMPSEEAVVPTGSSLLSGYLPGFQNMRASYRWIALGVLGAWLLLVCGISSNRKDVSTISMALAFGVVVLNIPDVQSRYQSSVSNREALISAHNDLVGSLDNTLRENERVVFLPYRNDFMVNYLAGALDIYTYNIGGDKNLSQASKHWPETMKGFVMGAYDERFDGRMLLLLSQGLVDAVVLPYFDLLDAAHRWPIKLDNKSKVQEILADIGDREFLSIEEGPFYSVVRLSKKGAKLAEKNVLEDRILKDFYYPAPVELNQKLRFNESGDGKGYLWEGWSYPESWGTWSNAGQATLILPLGSGRASSVKFDAIPFVGKHLKKQNIHISVNDVFVESITLDHEDHGFELEISDKMKDNSTIENMLKIRFEFPDAEAPAKLGINSDSRKLALGLKSLVVQ
ncbi:MULTISPECIES: hypothetical protein [Halomonadaceae]|uniref:Uncharacterized protein n=1 Tax=Vreelandella halophila TaxID=86177 RepID=A0A9X5B4C6_9GAMM|nr:MULTISPECIES: hypothetical protein [Halomonas]MYL25273.1 hypothetical protein [Halomonas utahensis]MYL75335.1 hypothetical protein [Halomonas sp. 22501_18_FS]